MKGELFGLIFGIFIGVVIGVLLVFFVLYCIRYWRKYGQINNSSFRRVVIIFIRINGVDICIVLFDFIFGVDLFKYYGKSINGIFLWFDGFKKSNVVFVFGIFEYFYRFVMIFV